MYIIEVPHQRRARAFEFDTELEWAEAAAAHADWTDPSHEPENLESITDEELIEWARHDLSTVYVLRTVGDLCNLRDRCLTIGSAVHQRARIAAICSKWVRDIAEEPER